MQKGLMALLALALVAGCDNRKADDETGAADRDRTGTDTVITTDRIQDTTVIRADTSIDVDTVKDTDHIKKEDH
ncbi:MAG TPA: hypothetical protein VFT84_13700 [Gemmatimonadales bacterium]|nr:hypothetical protein [Gemmatimonadales bacterium]